MPFDKITLNSGESLIMGHCPETLDLNKVARKQTTEGKSIESFGLFDTAQPNFQTYYPEVKAEDLKPSEDEFIRPVFRLLSETIVHRKWNPIDFALNKVLKASMPKLLGQTLYANHEAVVGNEIGSVAKVSWQESYEEKNGLIVPAGINGVLLIDGKSHPKTARAILMDPPAIHSNSVTVSFEWEQSHPKLSAEEFRGKLATFGSDGQLIRRVVKEINAYHETSLVAHGADPFAQLLRNGGINNPEYVKALEGLSAKNKTQHYFFSYKEDTESLSETPPTPEKNNDTDMKDVLLLLAVLFGEASLTEDQAKAKLSDPKFAGLKLEDLLKAKTDLDAEKLVSSGLQTKLTAAETEVTTLTAYKTTVEGLKEKKRTNVLRMYNVLFKDKTDAAMLASIATADDTLLTSLEGNYQTQMDDKFPGHCNDCQSTNVSRNSAVIDPKGGAGGDKGGKKDGETALLEKPLSNDEVAMEFAKPKFTLNKDK